MNGPAAGQADLRWTAVGRVEEWQDQRGRVVTVGARRIAVFRTGERFRALKDACPHAGVSLACGYVHGDEVVCPAHAWGFHLDDGHCTVGPGSAKAVSYAVRVVDGAVEVGVP
jgi:nitrite reductase/ring-hydroxylating ferredoxin subunit